MKIKPECAICIVRQVVDASKEITDIEEKQFYLIKETLKVIQEVYSPSTVPAWMGTVVHRYLKKISGCKDPYKRLKEKANDVALKYLKYAKEFCNVDNDLERLKRKIILSIAGNVIDYGAYSKDINVEEMLKKTLDEGLKIDHTLNLMEDLKNNKINNVLYICDNAGEIVFDKLLIDEIKSYGKNVVAVVKGEPILNDATLEDAKIAGIENVITTGSDVIGVILEECSREFLDHFNKADIIISKGMGNYESLTEYKLDKPIYFILKAKCKPVADHLGVNVGDNVCKKF
ncbi:hypothetical protein J422_03883 [Methanocaldococcus villosus KIN24-T80]|uniref:Damage-control phosphatase ARMT1-like metal-binding domain-containing protein n=1 Tax=Methanocaldococcus villosus KIN24-T80 TaxID=1069083 RepID=N6VQK0_9EURY|nr:DUF89 domain-containing protein [Methanocaldococcus villosus]ENN96165.1 hypothetical protein J422_03883 [Methanocaldococcus villosus KIN24-T80]